MADHRPEGVLTHDTVPPSFGPHRPIPAPFERRFYTAQDRPEIETLVHNLEHGTAADRRPIVHLKLLMAPGTARMVDHGGRHLQRKTLRQEAPIRAVPASKSPLPLSGGPFRAENGVRSLG